jgi:hypothetical protein
MTTPETGAKTTKKLRRAALIVASEKYPQTLHEPLQTCLAQTSQSLPAKRSLDSPFKNCFLVSTIQVCFDAEC